MFATFWQWLINLFRPKKKGTIVAVTATATLTSSGSLTAPLVGDVLTYTVTVTGDTHNASVAPGTFTDQGQTIPVGGGPWTWVIHDAEQFGAPVVSGVTLAKPFTQTADPHVFVATI
jgi:hypothetical protein